jgi:hypothetical protein
MRKNPIRAACCFARGAGLCLFLLVCGAFQWELLASPLLTAGNTLVGTNVYPYTNKPVAGSQINTNRPLAAGLVSALAINEGAGTNFYDAATQLSYPAVTLAGSPAGALPPAWFTPSVSSNYPWAGPAISNNGAAAQCILSPLQETNLINNVTNGYSYAELVEPLDTTTFGRIMDATGAAVIATYLNIPGRPGQVSTTWRDASDNAINPPANFTVNQWILVLCTVQQGLGVMYVNGVAAASSTNVNLTNSLGGQVGPLHYNTSGGNNPGSQMCNANFSGWWIWNNRVLTAAEAAQMYANPWAMFHSGAQRGYIKGTKVMLTNAAAVQNVWFYSHAAGGNVRLGIYDNGSPRNLLWQSGIISNTATEAWITEPVASGAPGTLALFPGTYWLAWQVDSTYDAPSYAAGTNGNGFFVSQSFGTFPASLAGAQSSAETWSEYFDYAQPTPPTFAGETWESGGTFQLQLNGASNVPFALQASTNLTDWTRLDAAGSVSNGSWLFLDTNAGGFSRRFYRAIWP